MSGNLSKLAFFEGGWVTLSADFRRKGHRLATTVGVTVSRVVCPFMWYQNICSASFSFVTMHACDDRRMDRIMTPKTALA